MVYFFSLFSLIFCCGSCGRDMKLVVIRVSFSAR